MALKFKKPKPAPRDHAAKMYGADSKSKKATVAAATPTKRLPK